MPSAARTAPAVALHSLPSQPRPHTLSQSGPRAAKAVEATSHVHLSLVLPGMRTQIACRTAPHLLSVNSCEHQQRTIPIHNRESCRKPDERGPAQHRLQGNLSATVGVRDWPRGNPRKLLQVQMHRQPTFHRVQRPARRKPKPASDASHDSASGQALTGPRHCKQNCDTEHARVRLFSSVGCKRLTHLAHNNTIARARTHTHPRAHLHAHHVRTQSDTQSAGSRREARGRQPDDRAWSTWHTR